MALARNGAQPDGHLLNHEERDDQQHLEQDELHPELRARGGSGRDAAGLGVGKRHDQARTGRRQIFPNDPATLGLRGRTRRVSRERRPSGSLSVFGGPTEYSRFS